MNCDSGLILLLNKIENHDSIVALNELYKSYEKAPLTGIENAVVRERFDKRFVKLFLLSQKKLELSNVVHSSFSFAVHIENGKIVVSGNQFTLDELQQTETIKRYVIPYLASHIRRMHPTASPA